MAKKTTVYLTDEMKTAVEREARRRGESEAEVIRRAVADAVTHPRPRGGFIEAEPFAEQTEDLLAGFGDR